jgi:uncharacterized protein YmfQ (DUF2313 family)
MATAQNLTVVSPALGTPQASMPTASITVGSPTLGAPLISPQTPTGQNLTVGSPVLGKAAVNPFFARNLATGSPSFTGPAIGIVNAPIDVSALYDRHVRRSGDDYAVAFSALLPRGAAWPREPETVLMSLIAGMAQIWGDPVDKRAADLLEQESDPRTTVELLPDWERNWGLPDPCFAEPLSVHDRQVALVQRMTIEGGQSRQFFVDVAAQLGYTITITEYRPFMTGIDKVGDNRVIGTGATMFDQFDYIILNPLGTPVQAGQYSEYPYMLGVPENRFYWTVHVGQTRLTWFRCASGQTGVDPHLRIGIATDVECVLNRWKPAHTDIIFDYSGSTSGNDPMAGTP